MEKRNQRSLESLVFLAPFGFFLVFFYLIPIAYIVYQTDLQQLASLLSDPYIIRLTQNTAIQAAASTIPSILLALPISYFFAKYSFRGSGLMRNLMLTPFFAPAFAVTEGMIMLLGQRGLVNQIGYVILGAQAPMIDVLYSMTAVVIAHVFYYMPLAVIILEEGFSRVDQELLDAANVAGAGWMLAFRATYANQLLPSVAAAGLLIFAFSFISYSTPVLIGGRFSTLEVEIYSTRTRPISASIALFQLCLTMVLSIVIIVFREKLYFRGKTVARAGSMSRPLFSGMAGRILLAYSTLLMLVELLPIYLILAQAVSTGPFILVPTSLSLDNYIQLMSVEFGFGIRFVDAFLQSLSIAVLASFLSLAISTLVIWMSGEMESIRRLNSLLLSIPISISRASLALGMMLSYGFGLLRLYGSWVLIVLGHVAIIVPLISRVIEASWLKIGPEVRQAAETSGASRIFRLIRLEIPLMAPAMVASFLLAFSSSISEFTFSDFFSTLSLMPLPVSVAALIDLRRLDLASALTGLIVVVVITAEILSSFASEEALEVF